MTQWFKERVVSIRREIQGLLEEERERGRKVGERKRKTERGRENKK